VSDFQTDFPPFSPEVAESIFTELGTLRVTLDEDPLAYGPKRLNRKVAEVRRMLDRCERIYLDVSHQLYRTNRELRISQTALDMAKKSLIANDPETRAGRSVADREAIATGKLAADMQKMHDLEVTAADLDAVLTVVKSKRSDLKDAEGRLKDQIRLCQTELVVGHQWGSQLPPGEPDIDLSKGQKAPSDAQEVSAIIGNVEGEIHLAEASGDWREPSPEEPAPEPAPMPTAVIQSVVEVPPEEESPEELLSGAVAEPSAATVLPGTTPADSVDNFLGTMTFADPPKVSKDRIPQEDLALTTDSLLDFLTDFEAP